MAVSLLQPFIIYVTRSVWFSENDGPATAESEGAQELRSTEKVGAYLRSGNVLDFVKLVLYVQYALLSFQEKVTDKGPPSIYLEKLRVYLDPKGTKKVRNME